MKAKYTYAVGVGAMVVGAWAGCSDGGSATGSADGSTGGPDAAPASIDATVDGSDDGAAPGMQDATRDGTTGDDATADGGADANGGTDGAADANGGTDGGADANGGTDADAGDAGVTPVVIDECTGAISASLQTALLAGRDAGADAGVPILYPYDGTVFPLGLAAPTVQWKSQTGATAVYVHLRSRHFDYKACFAAPSHARFALPASAWTAAQAASDGAGDSLAVEVTSTDGTVVTPVAHEAWTFARGALPGVVDYESFGSNLNPAKNGAILRLDPAATTPTVLAYTAGITPFGPCVGCHSTAANGSRVAFSQLAFPSNTPLDGKGSMTFDLGSARLPLDATAPMASTLATEWALSAMYPTGALLLTSGEPGDTSMMYGYAGQAGNNPGMIGPKPSTMYDTATGATIAFTGLTTQYAAMPMFSPDGKHIVYTDDEQTDAGWRGHSLTVMDFDLASKQFTNARAVFHDDTKYAGWASFTPDGQWVVFALGATDNFATVQAPPVSVPLSPTEIYIVSAAGGAAARRLDVTSGYRGGSIYLPGGAADATLDFYPSMSPVSTGGYSWLVFTSRRSYGNTLTDSTSSGSKAIWVAAIDATVTAGADPSHPAFFLPGQEIGTGNFHGTSAPAACKAAGRSCSAGYECCVGGCRANRCEQETGCALAGERCAHSADCCSPGDACIAGYCSPLTP